MYAPDEEYLNVALTHLLPEHYSATAGAGVREILRGLADRLIARHQDRWLADALKTPHSPAAAEAFAALGRAVRAGDANQPTAGAEARTAERLFRAAGSPAGWLYAGFQQVFALKLAGQYRACAGAVQRLRQSLRPYPYAALAVQTLLEEANCETWTGELDSAGASGDEALDQAHRHAYDVLLLRAKGFSAARQDHMGNAAKAWRENYSGLTLYWSAKLPLIRAQLFYSALALAEQRSNPYSAAAWSRELISIASILQRADLRASALWQLGMAELYAGLRDAAYRDFDLAVQARPSMRSDIMPAILLARLEASRGELDKALARLLAIREHAEDASPLLLLQFKAALGSLRLRRREYADARQLLEGAAQIGEASWSSTREAERVSWMRAMVDIYRGLVEADIRTSADGRPARRRWSLYRARLFAHGPVAAAEADSVSPGQARLSFAELSSGVAAWLETGRGSWFREIPSPQMLRDAAGRLARDCANAASREEVLRAEALDLSQRLLGTWDAELDGIESLVVETDGPVAQVPWSALVRSNRHYWSRDFAVRVRAGAASGVEPAAPLARVAHSLVVGAPFIEGEDLAPLPYAMEEAKQVSALFRRSTLLEGPQATLSDVRSQLAAAELFHFTGHGYGGEGGGLMLRGPSGRLAVLRAADIQDLDLSRCRLVVLGGCSTAAGESGGPGDPQSLVRSFLHAGAGEVVAGLWDLDLEGTQELMRGFYREMKTGLPVAESLRRAAAAVRAEPAYAHPYYWAGLEVFSNN